ncbi:MAG: DUF4349 domain-containing protein [Pseudolysinimonas sp.]
MRRTLIGSTVLLVAALALAGCAASSGAGDAGAPAPVEGAQAPGVVGDEAGGGSTGDGSTSSDRQVVISGDVTITAEDPLAASKQAVRIVESAGGRVDDRTEYAAGENDNGSAQLTLRIPADSLTAVLDKLEKLGTTEQVSLSTSDVTVETQDLDARIDALRASIGRLNTLIAKAKNISDLIALESEISSRQGELESLEAQQRYLADQVAMSSITLYLQSKAQAPVSQPDTFWDGLSAGWGAFVAFWAGLLVVLGVLLPWIVTLGVIALIIVLLVRRRQAKSRSSESSATP